MHTTGAQGVEKNEFYKCEGVDAPLTLYRGALVIFPNQIQDLSLGSLLRELDLQRSSDTNLEL